MLCKPRCCTHPAAPAFLCTLFFALVALSAPPTLAFGASEHVPRLLLDEGTSASEYNSLSASIANQSVRKHPRFFTDPPLSAPTLTQQTTVEETERQMPLDRRFKVMLAAGVGYGVMKQNLRLFGTGHSGVVIGGTLRIAYSSYSYFGLSYRRQKLDDEAHRSLKETETDQDGGIEISSLNWDIYIDELLFVVGWMSSPSSHRSLITYVDVGAGAMQIVQSATTSDGTGYEAADWNKTMFTFAINAGGTVPLTRELGLNIEGDWITALGSEIEWKSLFGLRIGLAVMLGGS